MRLSSKTFCKSWSKNTWPEPAGSVSLIRSLVRAIKLAIVPRTGIGCHLYLLRIGPRNPVAPVGMARTPLGLARACTGPPTVPQPAPRQLLIDASAALAAAAFSVVCGELASPAVWYCALFPCKTWALLLLFAMFLSFLCVLWSE